MFKARPEALAARGLDAGTLAARGLDPDALAARGPDAGALAARRLDPDALAARGLAARGLDAGTLAPTGGGAGSVAPEDTDLGVADSATSATSTHVTAELLARLKAGDASARRELVGRYQHLVTKIVFRSLGAHSEVEDTVHDVFVEALDKIRQVQHAEALTVWMMRVATSVVRAVLRRRARRRWLAFFAPSDLPEQEAPPVDGSARETLHQLYRTLDRLPDDERVAFSLRYLCDLDLVDTAEACGCSLATIKRRLVRAEQTFLELAADDPLLGVRIQRGTRWGNE